MKKVQVKTTFKDFYARLQVKVEDGFDEMFVTPVPFFKNTL